MAKKYEAKYTIKVERKQGDSNENPNYTLKKEGDQEYIKRNKENWMRIVEEGLKSLRERGEKVMTIESESELEDLVNPLEN